MSKFNVGDILTHKLYAVDPAVLYAPRFFVIAIESIQPGKVNCRCRIISVRSDSAHVDHQGCFGEEELITYEEYKKSVISTFEKTVQTISSMDELKAYISSMSNN